MAKKGNVVKINGIKDTRQNVINFINKQLRDQQLLNDLGKTAVDQIRNRTRAGLEEYKQDAIADSTKDRRDALVRAGNAFDPKIVKPKRSNLSMSGQLLDALSFRVNNARAIITVYLKRPRMPYKGLRKEFLENDRDNVQIKDDLLKQGREFLFVSEKLKAMLESKIAASIRKRLSLYRKFRSKL